MATAAASPSVKQLIAAIPILLGVVCVDAGAGSVQQQQVTLDHKVEFARQLIIALYPEVVQRHPEVELFIGPRYLDLPWSTTANLLLRLSEEDHLHGHVLHELLTIKMNIDDTGHLTRLASSGVTVNSDRKTQLLAGIGANVSTERELLTLLQTAGARFTPEQLKGSNQAFINDTLASLRPIIGNASIRTARFDVWDPVRFPRSAPAIRLEWHMELDGKDGDGRSWRYEITCEPFDGHIIAIAGARN
jgi:hypothetical protein